MTAISCLELFAGAGGAALGLRAAGLRGTCYEIDADAVATLKAAGFDAYQCDVRKGRWHGWRKANGSPFLLWASPPCQAFSTAGARLGAMDDRNGWPWPLDVIDAVAPRWAVCENVPGLTQHSGEYCGDPMRCPGCYWLRVVVPAFREWFVSVQVFRLNAADFGVPQSRWRVFLVAGPHAVKPPTPTHAAPHLCQGLFGTLKPWVSIGEALGLVGTMDGDRNSEANPGQERVRTTDEPAPTLGGMGNQMVRVIGGGCNPSHAGDVRTYRDITDEPSTTVTAVQVGNAGPFVLDVGQGNARPLDQPAHTLHTADGGPLPAPTVLTSEVKGSGKGANAHKMQKASDALYLGTGRRRLTVAECAKLQGFPDGHPFRGHGTKASQYRQVGNAVPPALAEAIARAIPSPKE